MRSTVVAVGSCGKSTPVKWCYWRRDEADGGYHRRGGCRMMGPAPQLELR
jgi:hypothetical protein